MWGGGLVFVDDGGWALSLPAFWQEAACLLLLRVVVDIPSHWGSVFAGLAMPWVDFWLGYKLWQTGTTDDRVQDLLAAAARVPSTRGGPLAGAWRS